MKTKTQNVVVPVFEVLVVVLVRVINLFFWHLRQLLEVATENQKTLFLTGESSESRASESAINLRRLPLTIQTTGTALIGQSSGTWSLVLESCVFEVMTHSAEMLKAKISPVVFDSPPEIRKQTKEVFKKKKKSIPSNNSSLSLFSIYRNLIAAFYEK